MTTKIDLEQHLFNLDGEIMEVEKEKQTIFNFFKTIFTYPVQDADKNINLITTVQINMLIAHKMKEPLEITSEEVVAVKKRLEASNTVEYLAAQAGFILEGEPNEYDPEVQDAMIKELRKENKSRTIVTGKEAKSKPSKPTTKKQ